MRESLIQEISFNIGFKAISDGVWNRGCEKSELLIKPAIWA